MAERRIMKTNREIADIFEEVANQLELDEANPYRVEAYRRAAAIIRGWPVEMAQMERAGIPFITIPGIGENLAASIREIVLTGSSHYLERIKQTTPRALLPLAAIPGFGPKRIKAIYEELGIKSLSDLKKAALAGKIREIPGFNYGIEARVLDFLRDVTPDVVPTGGGSPENEYRHQDRASSKRSPVKLE